MAAGGGFMESAGGLWSHWAQPAALAWLMALLWDLVDQELVQRGYVNYNQRSQ